MQCQCGSLNIVSIKAKCNDMFYCCSPDGKEHDGYVDNQIVNIGSGDYIEFSVCLDCNNIQHDVRPKPEKENDKKGNERNLGVLLP